MMNSATPLAAALILAASLASAQPTPVGGTGFNFSGTNSNPFGTLPNSDPDWIFKCGTPPFIACTPTEIQLRENVRRSGSCPTSPASARCTDFFMRSDSNPVENYAASTPPDGYKWSSPDCTRIPCRIDPVNPTTPAKSPVGTGLANATGSQGYGLPGGLVGPPDPRSGPQPFQDEASFREAMKIQEEATPGKVVDLGNRQYAVDIGGGQYSLGGQINGRPVSGMPVDAASIPGLGAALDKKQAADQVAAEIKQANDKMFSGTSAGGNEHAAATAPGGGRTDGAAVDETQRQIGGGGKGTGGSTVASSGGGNSGSGGGSGGGATANAGETKDVIKVDGSTIRVGEIETTFVHNQNAEKIISGAAKTYTNGQMTNFVDSSGQIGGTVNGRRADPPVDETQLGKIQAVRQ